MKTELLQFGPFSLHPHERQLKREGKPVAIGGRALEILMLLIEQPGRVVSKHELLKRVWPDVIVEEGSLRFHMAGLRKALGDAPDGSRYIATQVGVGYAFVAHVRRSTIEAPMDNAVRTSTRMPMRLAGGRRIFGRDDELSSLSRHLLTQRLLTIVGHAGVGKTTLAVELAHRLRENFAGNVAFVDLSSVSDHAHVAAHVAACLAIDVQSDDPMRCVVSHLHMARGLIILDGCERVIEGIAQLAETLASSAPHIHLLATSREPMRAAGECIYRLKPLACPSCEQEASLEEVTRFPAVQLLIDRARVASTETDPDEMNPALLAEICRRVDGLPLAIELAAARAVSYGLHSTAAQLGERLSLRWPGLRTARPYQRTLQATLDWSYDLLTREERQVFDRLSVFAGCFDLAAAIDVLADEQLLPDAVTTCLDALVTKSLVAVEDGSQGQLFRLLGITRSFAAEKLARRQSDEAQSMRRRMTQDYRPVLQEAAGSRLGLHGSPLFLHLPMLAERRRWCELTLTVPVDLMAELEMQHACSLSPSFTIGTGMPAEQTVARGCEPVSSNDGSRRLRALSLI